MHGILRLRVPRWAPCWTVFVRKGDGGLDSQVQIFELRFDRSELDVVAVQESREQG